MKPKLFFSFIFISLFLKSISQNHRKSYTKCEAINLFLNCKKVDSNFSRYSKTPDTLVVIDMDSSLTKCNITRFRNRPVKLITSGKLFDSVIKYNWPYLKIDKTNLYRFSSKHGNLFIQGAGSIISHGYVNIDRKGKYIIKRIEDSVE